MFMIIAAMHIPIVFFIGKESVLIIIDEILNKTTSKALIWNIHSQAEGLEDEISEISNKVYYSVATALYCLVVFLAIILPDISIVFGIVGSSAVSFVLFLGPAGYFLRGAHIRGIKIGLLEKLSAYFWVFLGFVIFLSGNFVVIYNNV